MRVFTCKDHAGHYPTGVASVIVAKTHREASEALDKELAAKGLKTSKDAPYTLELLSLKRPAVHILNDGEY